MIRTKGIVHIHEGVADTEELIGSVEQLEDGEYGYLLFDKKKNRSLPQLKFLFGYLLPELSRRLDGNPPPEALYRYFEELYAPLHSCEIKGEYEKFSYFDLKNEKAAEIGEVIERIINHAASKWSISLMPREDFYEREAQEAYLDAYAEMWRDYSRKI